ncbi:MAG: FecCD family ABC transporter permease [Gammaproteobacteria bacterium]
MRSRFVLVVCLVLLVATALAGIRYGVADLSYSRILDVVLVETGLRPEDQTALSAQERAIIWHIRLPRVLTGALVGAALALSGALLQGLFRNPMASPGIIGVSTGGALGATSAIALGLSSLSLWAVPLMAFNGALLSGFLVYALATRHGRTPLATLLLCGLAMNSITGALTSLVLSFSVREWEIGRQVLFWLMGDLSNRTWEHVAMIAPFLAVCAAASAFFPRELNLMMTGEESAMSLGVDTVRTKRLLLTVAAAAAGAAVAVAGVIGFVGLLVPHIVRLLLGPDHRQLLPVSLLAGAVFLMGMDVLARILLRSQEIRLGILTSGLGGPFFLYLILRHRRRAELL